MNTIFTNIHCLHYFQATLLCLQSYHLPAISMGAVGVEVELVLGVVIMMAGEVPLVLVMVSDEVLVMVWEVAIEMPVVVVVGRSAVKELAVVGVVAVEVLLAVTDEMPLLM